MLIFISGVRFFDYVSSLFIYLFIVIGLYNWQWVFQKNTLFLFSINFFFTLNYKFNLSFTNKFTKVEVFVFVSQILTSKNVHRVNKFKRFISVTCVLCFINIEAGRIHFTMF